MNKNTLAKIGASVAAVTPLFALAETTSDISDIIVQIERILNTVIPVLMVAATVVFLWGIISYITAAGDEKKAGAAKGIIMTGLIGLFFMVAVWGIVKVFTNTFGVGDTSIPGGVGEF